MTSLEQQMTSSIHNIKVDNDKQYTKNNNAESIVYGAMINLVWRDDIKIIRTIDFNDTVKYLENITIYNNQLLF